MSTDETQLLREIAEIERAMQKGEANDDAAEQLDDLYDELEQQS